MEQRGSAAAAQEPWQSKRKTAGQRQQPKPAAGAKQHNERSAAPKKAPQNVKHAHGPRKVRQYNQRPWAAGAIVLGPASVIKDLVKDANSCLQKRWEAAQETLDQMKNLHKRLKDANQLKKLKRKERTELLQEHRIDLDVLASTEFAIYCAMPLSCHPETFIVAEEETHRVRELESKMLLGLEDPLPSGPIEPQDLLCEAYESILQNFRPPKGEGQEKESNREEDMMYVVGIEPVSTNSLLCGYDEANFTLFNGAMEESERRNPLQAALRELEEEGCMDFSEWVEQRKSPRYRDIKGSRIFIFEIDETITWHERDGSLRMRTQQRQQVETKEEGKEEPIEGEKEAPEEREKEQEKEKDLRVESEKSLYHPEVVDPSPSAGVAEIDEPQPRAIPVDEHIDATWIPEEQAGSIQTKKKEKERERGKEKETEKEKKEEEKDELEGA